MNYNALIFNSLDVQGLDLVGKGYAFDANVLDVHYFANDETNQFYNQCTQ